MINFIKRYSVEIICVPVFFVCWALLALVMGAA
jgi:hypothetical protein